MHFSTEAAASAKLLAGHNADFEIYLFIKNNRPRRQQQVIETKASCCHIHGTA